MNPIVMLRVNFFCCLVFETTFRTEIIFGEIHRLRNLFHKDASVQIRNIFVLYLYPKAYMSGMDKGDL
jgi:hypothetical protein